MMVVFRVVPSPCSALVEAPAWHERPRPINGKKSNGSNWQSNGEKPTLNGKTPAWGRRPPDTHPAPENLPKRPEQDPPQQSSQPAASLFGTLSRDQHAVLIRVTETRKGKNEDQRKNSAEENVNHRASVANPPGP